MNKNEYLKRVRELYDKNKISTEAYDTMIENSKICSLIQVYHYPPDVEQPENTEGQENQES